MANGQSVLAWLALPVTLILITALVMAGVWYGVMQVVPVWERAQENKIRHQCAQDFRYTQAISETETVSYPMEAEYQSCLEERGN